MKRRIKKPTLTPWRQWAQEYQSKVPTFLHSDPEYVDKYSYAAWTECKKRVIEILDNYRQGHIDDKDAVLQIEPDWEYFNLDALKEIKKL